MAAGRGFDLRKGPKVAGLSFQWGMYLSLQATRKLCA